MILSCVLTAEISAKNEATLFIREVQPFILALIIALLLITYIPGI